MRLRSTCGLQLRTLAQTPQYARKGFFCGFSADASTAEGSHVEEKLENSVTSSDKEIAHVTKDAVQPEGSEGTQFEASIKVGAPYIRFIVGRGGRRKTSIEKATNASVAVPRARDVRSSVSLVVKGASQESVDAALAKIKDVLTRAERNPNLQYTHFLSLPLASHQGLVEQLRSFRKSVLQEEEKARSYISWFPETTEKGSSNAAAAVDTNDKASKVKSNRVLDPDLEGFFSDDESSDDENERHESPLSRITASLFIKPQTVHITVLMLKLFTDERVKVAAETLQGVQSRVREILDGQEPKVLLRGIECLRGTPAEARVLSMKVQEADSGNRLQQACHAIKDAFAEAGLVAAADLRQDLMLHATLMNTSLGRKFANKPFDARKILAKYRLQNWGQHNINEVHLSQRFFYDKSGYYRCCGSFQLSSAVSQVSD